MFAMTGDLGWLDNKSINVTLFRYFISDYFNSVSKYMSVLFSTK